MVSWQAHAQAPKQKVHFVQWHEVAVQMLHMIPAVLVVVELPLTIDCFAIQFGMGLHELLQLGLGSVLLLL